MKKQYTVVIALVLAMLQGCSQPEIIPHQPQSALTPPGFSIAQVAAAIQENFVLSGANAILLKPVDQDPNTHLTTLYMADANGKISPIVENFEVKDIRATTTGIYVLTNYAAIAFFVKYDTDWVELKNVAAFAGEDDNGNLVFRDGAILNTQTLQTDRRYVKEYNYVTSVSGNLAYIQENNARGIVIGAKIRNHVTSTEYTISNPQIASGYIASFKGTDFALIPAGPASKTHIINMKTGQRTPPEDIADFGLTTNILRLNDGSIVGLKPASPSEPKLKLAHLAVKQNNNGQVIPDRIAYSSVTVNPVAFNTKALFGSDTYYVYREADRLKVFDKSLIYKEDILIGLFNVTLSLVDDIIYYSGIDINNKPVSGIYDLGAHQNTVLNTEYTFSSIQPL